MKKSSKSGQTKKASKRVSNSRTRRSAKLVASQSNDSATISLNRVKEIAAKSLQLGLGVGAEIIDNIQEININELSGNLRKQLNRFVNRAMVKGEKIEREQRKWLVGFERKQRTRIETFLADYR